MTRTFKKWGYGAGGASMIFDVSADNPTLPQGWYESPADVPAGASPPPREPPPPPVAAHPPGEVETPSTLAGAGIQEILRRAAEAESEDLEEPSPEEERDRLRAEAEELGIKVDRRWSVDTLAKMIEAARGNDDA